MQTGTPGMAHCHTLARSALILNIHPTRPRERVPSPPYHRTTVPPTTAIHAEQADAAEWAGLIAHDGLPPSPELAPSIQPSLRGSTPGSAGPSPMKIVISGLTAWFTIDGRYP